MSILSLTEWIRNAVILSHSLPALVVLLACLPVAAWHDRNGNTPSALPKAQAPGPSVDEEAEAAFPAFEERLRAKRQRMEADLGKRKLEPWEGTFSNGNSFYPGGFIISRKEGYLSTSRLMDMGTIKRKGERIQLISENPYMKGRVKEYVIIPWDRRVYLIEPGGLFDFCNRVNSGRARTFSAPTCGYLKVENPPTLPRGLPAVPTEYQDYLLPEPLKARVIRMDRTQTRIIPLGYSRAEQGFVAKVDVGYKQGLRVGMQLYPQDPEIWAIASVISVAPKTASVLVVYQGSTKAKVVVGNLLSTLSP